MTATIVGYRVTRIPTRFRFSDDNPVTGQTYARSRFTDLPGYAQAVIETDLGVTPAGWDALVDAGEAYSAVGHRRRYSITRWVRDQLVYRSGRHAGATTCPDCFGTTVDFDIDGSSTGVVNAPIMCLCVELSTPRVHRGPTGPTRVGWPGAPRDYR